MARQRAHCIRHRGNVLHLVQRPSVACRGTIAAQWQRERAHERAGGMHGCGGAGRRTPSPGPGAAVAVPGHGRRTRHAGRTRAGIDARRQHGPPARVLARWTSDILLEQPQRKPGYLADGPRVGRVVPDHRRSGSRLGPVDPARRPRAALEFGPHRKLRDMDRVARRVGRDPAVHTPAPTPRIAR